MNSTTYYIRNREIMLNRAKSYNENDKERKTKIASKK